MTDPIAIALVALAVAFIAGRFDWISGELAMVLGIAVLGVSSVAWVLGYIGLLELSGLVIVVGACVALVRVEAALVLGGAIAVGFVAQSSASFISPGSPAPQDDTNPQGEMTMTTDQTGGDK